MKKIGIMGGTFNPIHNAHIMMAQAAYEQYGLDEVWFMPSGNPPHKKKKHIVSDEHRLRMIQFAIDGIEYFSLSDRELKRKGTTYTSETLEELKKEYPNVSFYFILGGDSLADFPQWHCPEKILALCKILAVPRGTVSEEKMRRLCRENAERFQGEVLPVSMSYVDISSRQIRKSVKRGQSAQAFCPDKVWRYMQLHELYHAKKTAGSESVGMDDLLFSLSSTLRPKRYRHTLGVASTAALLAACYGVDEKKAQMAGMLHDCAKYYTSSEMIALCRQYDIALTETECENPALIHGKLGAFLAEKRYGIKDKEILSAIRFHTTGKPGMTQLEKILYVADYIEPERNMDCKPHSLPAVRKECFRNLDRGLLWILENSIAYLADSQKPVDQLSVQTYEYYKRQT